MVTEKSSKKFRENDDIAIVGIACRFPGANDYNQFWSNLENGTNSIQTIPPDRWDIADFYSEDVNSSNKAISKWCGIVDNVDQFDNEFFQISPREANNMDPQQRLLLEEMQHCIDDSAISKKKLQQQKTSVYVGVMSVDYRQQASNSMLETDSYACLGNYECILANRISHEFHFRGESMSINAACASSLVAIHEAKRSLRLGESDYAFACGVNLNLHPWKYISFSKSRMLSPDGLCKTFDKGANGYVPGDGIGVLLLQRLGDAIKDRNHIYGIIKGSAVNHCGGAASITAPSVEAQRDVILEAYNDSTFGADSVTYVEAHGTGTSLGDPIEVEALKQAFKTFGLTKESKCLIGSVKTNIGHLEAAAGVAGVIKVLMMLKHRKIPKSLNMTELNPICDFSQSQFAVATKLVEWKTSNYVPVRAGVSSFGFGGVNSHILIEEFTGYTNKLDESTLKAEQYPFILSAKSPGSLLRLREAWMNYIQTEFFKEASLKDICLSLLHGRESHPYRIGGLVRSTEELIMVLQQDITYDKPTRFTICLHISGQLWEGYPQLDPKALEWKELKNNFTHLLKAADVPDCTTTQNVWSPKDQLIISFIFQCAYIMTMMEYGLRPSMITGQKEGIGVALVTSDMISFKDFIDVLSGQAQINQFRLNRPSTDFIIPGTAELISPTSFDQDYLSELTRNLSEAVSPVLLAHYVNKAKLLQDNQFTYKKLLNEWDTLLTQYGLSVQSMMESAAAVVTNSNATRSEDVLLLCIIKYCIRKINQKWNLSEQRLITEPRFHELLDLVVDDVLQKEDFIKLMLYNSLEHSRILKRMNEGIKKIGRQKSYSGAHSIQPYLDKAIEESIWMNMNEVLPDQWQEKLSKNTLYLSSGKIQDDAPNQLKLFDGPHVEWQRTLLDLWLYGMDIAWDKLFPISEFTSVALPTYRFEGKSFWLKGAGQEMKPAHVAKTIADQIIQVQKHQFLLELDGTESYFNNHVVDTKVVLPGVVYLEMARVVGRLSKSGDVLSIKNLLWAQPLKQSEDIRAIVTTVKIGISERNDGMDFEVTTVDEAESHKQIHVQGRIHINEGRNQNSWNEVIDVSAIKSQFHMIKENQECYKLFCEMGLEYGPFYQVIRQLYLHDNHAYAHLEISKEQWIAANDEQLHPGLMDGAMQTAVALIRELNVYEEDTYLPFALEEFLQIRLLTRTCHVFATLERQYNNMFKLVVKLFDDKGRLAILLNGLTLKKYRTTQEIHYFTHKWSKAECKINNHEVLDSRTLLVFGRDEQAYNYLLEAGGYSPSNSLLITPGERFQQYSENHLQINLAIRDDYYQLVKLVKNTQQPVDIVYLWSLDEAEIVHSSEQEKLLAGLYSIFRLIQAFMNENWRNKTRLLHVYHTNPYYSDPPFAAIGGFGRSLRLENLKYIVKNVEFTYLPAPSMLANELLNELLSDDEYEVRYEEDARYIKTYHQASEAPLKNDQLLTGIMPKEYGVYLITGGMGGLGILFADYLVRQYKARLVLTGRSELTTEQHRQISLWNHLGAEVSYIRGDIGDSGDVEYLFLQIKEKYGELNGLIHAAGILKDSFLMKKTEQDFTEVLRSKITGLINLDEKYKNEQLDFFVVFSSIMAELGNLGQTDYATANSYMDHFVYMREHLRKQGQRSGKSISINWPLWEKGGMQIGEESQHWLRDAFGLELLHSAAGINAFLEGLRSQHTQLIVASGDQEKLHSVLKVNNQILDTRVNRAVDERATRNKLNSTDHLINAAVQLLKTVISQETQYDEMQIYEEEPFENYGIDSVMVMNLTQKLEHHFGELSKTLFFEYQNVRELAQYLAQDHSQTIIKIAAPSTNSVELPVGGLNAVRSAEGEKPVKTAEGTKESLSYPKQHTTEDIAIIGISGKYPMSSDLEEYWSNLVQGKDCIVTIPEDRWPLESFFDPNKENAGRKSYSKWGGFIDDVDKFDPMFFNITPKEAMLMDPQERLFLETAWHVLEDAGYPRSRLWKKPIGVYVGVMYGHYQLFGAEQTLLGNPVAPGGLYSSIANRISYFFNWVGPSIALDTMCSSSLTTIHLACESLRSGDCEMALAGGVNVSIHPNKYLFLSEGNFLSSEGRCRSFGEDGDGYVPGEGVGAVLLKPLSQALVDGDRIHAVIKGSSINHGGKTNGYTVPNPNEQTNLIVRAIQKADIDPRTISYLEAHGTGTALGDPIEMTGLTKSFQQYTKEKEFCAIGSVKSNIGHLESAAGIAGLTKVILQMRNKMLVPSIHSERLNKLVNFSESPFYLQKTVEEWQQPIIDGVTYPRRAGLSSFGAGGSNAHIILEEYVSNECFTRRPEVDVDRQIIVLSAKTKDSLIEYARHLQSFLRNSLEQDTTSSIRDITFTLQVGREHLEERFAIVVKDIQQGIEKLEEYVEGKSKINALYTGRVVTNRNDEDWLFDGAEADGFVQSIIQQKKHHKIAQLWVRGASIDWESLYHDNRPSILSLPHYPFSKERYWIENMTKAINPSARVERYKLHPFIDENKSTFQEQCFTKRFGSDDTFICDHIIKGRKTLPGVVSLEMARIAGQLSNGTATVRGLTNVVWITPLQIGDNEWIDARIGLLPNEKGVRFEVGSHVGPEGKIVYVEGSIDYYPLDEMFSERVVIQPNIIKERCRNQISGEACYEDFIQRGYQYGKSMQVLQSVQYNEDEVLSLILNGDDQAGLYLLHPSVLDGALQTALAFLARTQYKEPTALYLPISLQQLEIFGTLNNRCYVHAVPNREIRNKSMFSFDITIMDEGGNPLILMKNLILKKLSTHHFSSGSNTASQRDIIINMLHKLNKGEIMVEDARVLLGGLLHE